MKSHCEVSNALKKWHTAYHGTSVGTLRRTLDHGQLLPGTTDSFRLNLNLFRFSKAGFLLTACVCVLSQGRLPSSPRLRWRPRVPTATASPRRTAPPAGRFPERASPPPCATRVWRSLLPKCSEFTARLFPVPPSERDLTAPALFLFNADLGTPALIDVTRLRWASRCACGRAPTRWELRPSATARPWTLALATLRSSGSPRSRGARCCTDCWSGWSEELLINKLNLRLEQRDSSETPLSVSVLAVPPQTALTAGALFVCLFVFFGVISKNRHCLHFMFRTLVGDF